MRGDLQSILTCSGMRKMSACSHRTKEENLRPMPRSCPPDDGIQVLTIRERSEIHMQVSTINLTLTIVH